MKLKLLDLFSGIGGFSLGLESTGFFETIAFVEKDKFCQKVLKKNFKNITIEGDIRNVKGSNYKADVITGGFPCQPFSIAGKRKGTDDDRYLWDETIRVIRECKPRWFIGENVEGIINIQDGMVLRQVCDDLEKEGFEVQCLVIPASGIGAWHQRKRVWIMAHSNSNRHRNEIEGSSTKKKRISKEHRKEYNTSRKSSRASTLWNGDNEYVPNTNISSKTQRGEYENDEKTSSSREHFKGRSISYGGEGCVQSTWKSEDVSNSNGKESFKEQQTWWQTQSSLCGVPNGVSYELDKDRTNRIKSLGNSIVPLIARELGLAIMKAELDETS